MRARILVADDDESVRQRTAFALLHAGLGVETATDSESALSRTEGDKPFDIVVTDLIMVPTPGDCFLIAGSGTF